MSKEVFKSTSENKYQGAVGAAITGGVGLARSAAKPYTSRAWAHDKDGNAIGFINRRLWQAGDSRTGGRFAGTRFGRILERVTTGGHWDSEGASADAYRRHLADRATRGVDTTTPAGPPAGAGTPPTHGGGGPGTGAPPTGAPPTP